MGFHLAFFKYQYHANLTRIEASTIKFKCNNISECLQQADISCATLRVGAKYTQRMVFLPSQVLPELQRILKDQGDLLQ